jgi:hypothetical protein
MSAQSAAAQQSPAAGAAPSPTKGAKPIVRSTRKTPGTTMRTRKGQDLKRRVRNAKFSGAIHKRGSKDVSGIKVDEDDKPVVSPFTLAILIFVVCGSGTWF